jgi:hypothetical protein
MLDPPPRRTNDREHVGVGHSSVVGLQLPLAKKCLLSGTATFGSIFGFPPAHPLRSLGAAASFAVFRRHGPLFEILAPGIAASLERGKLRISVRRAGRPIALRVARATN